MARYRSWGLGTDRDDDWRLRAACRGHEHPDWWETTSGRPSFARL